VTTNRHNQCSAQNMKLAINYAIAAVILLLSFVAPVTAGPLEDGVAAFVRGDYGAAMLDFLPLAYQGDAIAQNYLGDIYYEGLGVPRRDDLAAQWYLKAAKQGYRESQTALGTMYFDGFGVPQSYPKAIQWWRKAAVQGGSRAQNSLGALQVVQFIGNTGPYKSAVKAQLDRITQLMTPAQIAKAQNLAREWRPTTVRAVRLTRSTP
jgi:TPR repeat protein